MPCDAEPRPSRALLLRGRRAVSRWVRPTLRARDAFGVLTSAELGDLRALTEAIAAGGPVDDADWAPIADTLMLRARHTRGFAGLCARACRRLDALAGGRFEALSAAERGRVIAAHRLGTHPVPAAELLLVGRRADHEIRDLVVPEIIRAYYDSPAGWRVIGYDAVLGACREPFAYTSAPT